MKKTLLSLLVFTTICVYGQDAKKADECLKAGNFKCAETEYQLLVSKEKIQKILSEHYVGLGMAQRRLGKPALAIKSFESAIRINPMSVPAYVNMASVQSMKGDKQKALEYITKGLKAEQESPDLYLTRSRIYDDMGKKDLAKEDLNTILTFAPDNLYARTGLASLKNKSGDLQGALKDYNQLISEKPESLLYNGRAEVYYKMKKQKEALADVNKAIAVDAKFAPSHVTKALILFSTGKGKEACSSLDKAVALGYEKSLLADEYGKCINK